MPAADKVVSLAVALNIAVNFYYARKQWQLLQECAEEQIALATQHGFAQQWITTLCIHVICIRGSSQGT